MNVIKAMGASVQAQLEVKSDTEGEVKLEDFSLSPLRMMDYATALAVAKEIGYEVQYDGQSYKASTAAHARHFLLYHPYGIGMLFALAAEHADGEWLKLLERLEICPLDEDTMKLAYELCGITVPEEEPKKKKAAAKKK